MKGLLEEILGKSNLNYISDLNGRLQEDSVKKALKEVDAGKYELREWIEAMGYLTGGNSFSNMPEIIEYIKNL